MTTRTKGLISPVVKNIPPSGIRRFFDLVSEVEGVISLGVGEPDFVTPWHIRESCIYSLEKGYTMYTSNHGTKELRREIARYLYDTSEVAYDPEGEILVTVGVSQAYDLAVRAILSPGDEVLIPEPSYVAYKPCVAFAGGVPVVIETRPENEFKLSPGDLKDAITPKTRALVLCFPNNPTGAIMTKEELLEIAKIVEENDLLVISDEIYGELTYEGKHISFASLSGMRDRTILLNGFSKAFAMTGWRLGYAASCKEIIDAMVKIHQYTMLCAPIMAQNAALEALKNGEREMHKMISQYDRRRKLISKGLNDMGLSCHEPKGAFYAFPSVGATGMTSEEFAEGLLKEEKVAVVPGTAFGKGGEGHIRCSYAASIDDINEALLRMERFVKKHIR
jgi:aminotransferase